MSSGNVRCGWSGIAASPGVSDGGHTAILKQLGIRRDTLPQWVRDEEAERAPARRYAGTSAPASAKLKRENPELCRASEILTSAAASWGRSSSRPKK